MTTIALADGKMCYYLSAASLSPLHPFAGGEGQGEGGFYLLFH